VKTFYSSGLSKDFTHTLWFEFYHQEQLFDYPDQIQGCARGDLQWLDILNERWRL